MPKAKRQPVIDSRKLSHVDKIVAVYLLQKCKGKIKIPKYLWDSLLESYKDFGIDIEMNDREVTFSLNKNET